MDKGFVVALRSFGISRDGYSEVFFEVSNSSYFFFFSFFFSMFSALNSNFPLVADVVLLGQDY